MSVRKASRKQPRSGLTFGVRAIIAVCGLTVAGALSSHLLASKPDVRTETDPATVAAAVDAAYPAQNAFPSRLLRQADGSFSAVHPPLTLTREELDAQVLHLPNLLRTERAQLQSRFGAYFTQPQQVCFAGVDVFVSPVGASTRSFGRVLPDGTLVYTNAFENCDVAFRCSPQKAEEYLLVRDSNGSAAWTWNIDLHAAGTELHPRLSAAGFIELLDPSGTARLRIDAPEGKDAAGRHLRYGRRLLYALDEAAPGMLRLTLKADLRGLNYPVVIDPSWSPTSAMINQRASHTGTLLQNNKVLIAGGTNGSAISFCELFDPAGNGGLGAFTATGNLNTARSQHVAVLLADGRVFVVGGLDTSSTALNSAEIFDPAGNSGAGSWTAVTATMAAGRFEHTATLLSSGKVLVAGGVTTTLPVKTAEIFDPSNNTFAAAPSMSVERLMHTATLLSSGKVLVTGGQDTSLTYNQTAEVFDETANSGAGAWTPTASTMSTARYSHKAILLPNGQVLIAGGFNPGLFPSAETYDPASNSFNPTGSMSRVRTEHRIAILKNGKVVLCGCHDGSFANVELYDPFTTPLGSFQITGSMVTPHTKHTVTTLSDFRVLVTGGFTGSYLNTAEIYDPHSEPIPQTVTANGSTPLAITFSTNSIDDNAPSFAVASQPGHGNLSGTGNSRLYTATAGYSGTDTFTFTSTDTFGVSKPGTITVTVNSLVPTITSTSPDASIAGSAGFTLTVNGTGFVTGSQVQFNGSSRSTTFVNTTTLTATIPASDVAVAGNYAISVVNPTPGGGTSAPQTFTVMGGTLGVWVVTNRLDSGSGSLRFCMNNVHSGDTIVFDPTVFALVNSSAATVINILSQLPTMDKGNVTIDASNTRVTINGSGAGSSYGLLITSDNNKIMGLSIVGFTKDGIGIIGGNANLIGGSRVLPATGTGPNGQGLRIAGNGAFGVEIDAGGHNNIVKGCWIGLDASGAASQPNLAGILMQNGSNNNQIGSTLTDEANFISGNLFEGITVSDVGTDNNIVMGNIVGASALLTSPPTTNSVSRDIGDDFTALGGRGAVANGGAGVFLSKGTNDTQIGGDTPGLSNGIGYNGGNGVEVRANNSKKNSSKGNHISGNKRGGIALFDGSNNGIQPPQIDVVFRNDAISGRADGSTTNVHISGHASTDGTVEIYTDPSTEGGSLWGRTPCSGGKFETDVALNPNENITATITDTNGNTSSFSVFGPAPSFGKPSITSSLTAVGMINTPFSYQLTAGGSQPIVYAASNLPAGLVLSGDTISGTPTASGTFMVHLTATNSVGTTSTTLIIVVNSDFTIDTDGDGVPDWLETLAGTDPNDALSFPATQDALSVDKITFRLGAGTAPDLMSVQLRVTLPAGLVTKGTMTNIQVGNVNRSGLTLDDKGHASKGTTSIIVKPASKGSNTLLVSLSIKNDHLKVNLAANGITDVTTDPKGTVVSLPVGLAVISNGNSYVTNNTVSVIYTAKKGRGGTGRKAK